MQYAALTLFSLSFITVFSLYLLTLAPGVVGGDAGEHQFAVPLLGIPHTTGYPLYVLIGKLWTLLLPLGTMAWRMNLFSAFGGALAAATTTLTVYRLAQTLTTHHTPRTISPVTWPGALVAGIALAFGLTLWQWSIIAGVRSFNVFFFALLTLEAIIWANLRQQSHPRQAERTLLWLALTVGLSLAHHRTTIFYLPLLVGWIWWYHRRLIRQPKRIVILALLALAPLSLYLFIYLRGLNNPPYTHEPIYNLQSFWFLVGSGDSKGLFFSIDPAYLPARLAFIWADILKQISWPGVLLAIIGAFSLIRRGLPHFIFQGTLVLFLLLFTLDFEVVNLNEAPTWYLMPAYFIFAVWLGLGVNTTLDFGFRIYDLYPAPHSTSHVPRPTFFFKTLTTLAFIILLTISLGFPNWQYQATIASQPLDDWRQLLRGTQGQRFVENSLPYVAPNSIIWGDWEQYTTIKYYQLINGLRPDVTPRNPLNNWPEKVVKAHQSGQPIYFMRKPADLLGTPHLTMVGPLIHLDSKPNTTIPNKITVLKANFEDELELVGYSPQQYPQPNAATMLQLMLYWRVPKAIDWDYALSLRVINAAGQEVYKKDASHPVLSSYPTTLWTPGEVVGDFYELPLPANGGPFSLHLIPYRTEGPNQWYNLSRTDVEPPTEGVVLGPF